ncbi:hypothetical protein Hanom_Chr15g01365371 [Helianthus anomalus]
MRNWLGFLLSIIRSLASLRCLKSVNSIFDYYFETLWVFISTNSNTLILQTMVEI